MHQLRDAAVLDYETGTRRFSFVKSIYGGKVTKKQFAVAQYMKCCFCEAVFDANVAGDVEHYRPKKSVTTNAGAVYPGYYWLAYEFSNLFYSCPDCNQYKKKNWFPLGVEANRARSHHQNENFERPLLLSPGGPLNPRRHIRFDRDFPVGVTREGQTTIRILGLDREPLNRQRRKILARLEADRNVVKLLGADPRPEAQAEVDRANLALAEAVLPSAEFSAAAQDYLLGWRA
jgi:hypothetical protein